MARIGALLESHQLARYRDDILSRGSPCVAIALKDPPSASLPDLPPVRIGSSKIGGDPDLPPGFAWPVGDDGQAGFYLQIVLADLPRASWNPFPSQGMLFVFCHDDQRAFWDPPGWEVVWWNGDPASLVRTPRDVPALNPLVGESVFFSTSLSRPLTFRAGTDFPPGSQSDWDWINAFERRTRDSDGEALNRYFDFVIDAADPGAAADRAAGRGPYFHPIGRLLGHTDSSIREELTLAARGASDRFRDYDWRRAHRDELAKEGASWRQLMRLFSSTAIEYMSPCDAAPNYLMAQDTGARPWTPGGGIVGLASS